jgi:secondary thiamine-phosphate synthase enzyme
VWVQRALTLDARPRGVHLVTREVLGAVPEDSPWWTHVMEGPDDMPAHVKSVIVGPSLMIPVSGGEPALGTWQGIYLLEHRDHGGARRLVLTAWGEAS